MNVHSLQALRILYARHYPGTELPPPPPPDVVASANAFRTSVFGGSPALVTESDPEQPPPSRMTFRSLAGDASEIQTALLFSKSHASDPQPERPTLIEEMEDLLKLSAMDASAMRRPDIERELSLRGCMCEPAAKIVNLQKTLVMSRRAKLLSAAIAEVVELAQSADVLSTTLHGGTASSNQESCQSNTNASTTQINANHVTNPDETTANAAINNTGIANTTASAFDTVAMGSLESLRLINQSNNAGRTERPHVHQTLSANTGIRIEQSNPKKKDSKSYHRYEASMEATTVAAYINMHTSYGARDSTMQGTEMQEKLIKQAWLDFKSDVDKGFITVVDIDKLYACNSTSREAFKLAAALTT